MDKLDCIKVFTRVATLGSFTATANELNVTQSSISKKIAWLENDLGITLFSRHARAISLTSSGQKYLEFALKLTEDTHLFESQLRQEQTSVSGTLKLSVPSAFSVRLLSQPLSDFMCLHSNLNVDVSVSDTLVDLVDGNIDVAIRASYLKDSGLKAKWLMDNELAYFASPKYLDNHPKIENANDLVHHQCLTYSLSIPSNLWRFSIDKNTLKVRVKERLRSDSPEMLVQMAKLGEGVAAMPKWMIENELQDGSLQLILEQYQQTKLPMYLVFKDSEHQPQRIRAFIDFLSDYFATQ